MKTQFATARRLLLEVREGLVRTPAQPPGLPRSARSQERLERVEAESASGPASSSAHLSAAEAQASRLADAVAARLALLHNAVATCEATLAGGGAGGGEELWARKVEQAAEEAGQLQAGLTRWHVQHGSSRRQSAAEARSELFRRTGGVRGQLRSRALALRSALLTLASSRPGCRQRGWRSKGSSRGV